MNKFQKNDIVYHINSKQKYVIDFVTSFDGCIYVAHSLDDKHHGFVDEHLLVEAKMFDYNKDFEALIEDPKTS